MFRNPLLERDFLRLARKPGVWRDRTLVTGFTATMAVLVAGTTLRRNADEAAALFHTAFALCTAVFLAFQSVGEAALAVPTERATGSLPVLLTVPRRPVSVAFGLLGARWMQAAFSLLALLPVGGVVFLLGGIGLGRWATTLLAFALIIVQGSCLGLLAGARQRETRQASARGYAGALLAWLFLPGALALGGVVVAFGSGEWKTWGETLMSCGSGLFAMGPFPTLFQGAFGRGSGIAANPFPVWLDPVVVSVVATLLLVAVTLRVSAVRLHGEEEWGTATGPRAAATASVAIRVHPEARPLVWREGRPVRGVWARVKRALPWVGWILYLGWFSWMAWGLEAWRYASRSMLPPDNWMFDVLLALPVWFFPVAVFFSAGTYLPEQREKGVLDVLYALPLPAIHYATVRVESLLRRYRRPVFLLLAVWVAAVLTGRCHPLGLPSAVLGAAIALPMLLTLSLTLGSFAPNTRGASRRLGAGLFTMWMLFPAGVGILAGVSGVEELGYAVALDPLVTPAAPFLLLVADGTDMRTFAFTALGGAVLGLVAAGMLWRRVLARISEDGNLGPPGRGTP